MWLFQFRPRTLRQLGSYGQKAKEHLLKENLFWDLFATGLSGWAQSHLLTSKTQLCRAESDVAAELIWAQGRTHLRKAVVKGVPSKALQEAEKQKSREEWSYMNNWWDKNFGHNIMSVNHILPGTSLFLALLEHFKWIFLGIGAMENVKNRGLFHLLGEFKVPSLYDVRRTIKFYLSRAGCP